MKALQLEIVKNDRLYMKVAEQLSNLIQDGIILPGERFPPERELAEQLGVSRPTVREAMIALEIGGAIEIRTGSGIYANQPTDLVELTLKPHDIDPFEVFELRLVIESEACALAATRLTKAQLEKLKLALLDMQTEKQANAIEKADQRFHKIIAKSCQNSAIESMVSWLWRLRKESKISAQQLEPTHKEGIHPSISEHHKILSALERGDADGARDAMRKHIKSASENAAQYFRKVRRFENE